MTVLLWAALVVGAFWLLVAPAVTHQTRHPNYPRPRLMMMVQKLGESFDIWGYRDTFGLHQSKDWLPPPPETPTVATVTSTEVRVGTVRTKTKVEEILGQ